jgi:HTH-type transcriptional regulator, competence development regulator
MSQKLAEELRRIRGVRGVSLRDVENETEVSNAYLSQLETGKTSNPSPQVLHRLAGYYRVPYESLMEAAGYLEKEPASTRSSKKRVGALQAALMSAQLTDEEQRKVAEFIEFVRSKRGSKSK